MHVKVNDHPGIIIEDVTLDGKSYTNLACEANSDEGWIEVWERDPNGKVLRDPVTGAHKRVRLTGVVHIQYREVNPTPLGDGHNNPNPILL